MTSIIAATIFVSVSVTSSFVPLTSLSVAEQGTPEFRLAAGLGNRSGIVASVDLKTNSKGLVTGAYGEGVPEGAGIGFFARQGTKNTWYGAGVGYYNSLKQDSRTWDFFKIGATGIGARVFVGAGKGSGFVELGFTKLPGNAPTSPTLYFGVRK